MKTILVCFLVLGCVTYIQGGVIEDIVRGVCPFVCPRACDIYSFPLKTFCQIKCRIFCPNNNGRKRRDVSENVSGHITPLPDRFDAYDLNDDGFVTKEELIAAIGDSESNPDVVQAFGLSNKNEDGKLTAVELFKGPLVFEHHFTDENSLAYCQQLLNGDSTSADVDV